MDTASDLSNFTKIDEKGSTSVAQATSSFNFTKRAIEALPVPGNGRRVYYRDTKTRGLAVAVSAVSKKFLLYRKISGHPERIPIGAFPDLSVEQARGAASALNAAIARGQNPAQDRRGIAAEITLGELFAEFGERYGKEKISWPKMEQQFEDYLHGWRLRKLSSIRSVDVIALHSRVGRESGHYAANRLIETLRSMYARAQEWGWQGANPAKHVKTFPEVKRERFLQEDEFPAFFKALADESDVDVRDYILLSLFTGARRANVLEMRWAEISFERATWGIPRTKSGKPATVELIPPAVLLLEQRQTSKRYEWVFPAATKSGHMPPPKTQWATFLKRAELTDFRPHDLRRTHASWQAITGASLLVIAKSLQQSSTRATEIYARLSESPVRAARMKAVNKMLGFGGDVLKLAE